MPSRRSVTCGLLTVMRSIDLPPVDRRSARSNRSDPGRSRTRTQAVGMDAGSWASGWQVLFPGPLSLAV